MLASARWDAIGKLVGFSCWLLAAFLGVAAGCFLVDVHTHNGGEKSIAYVTGIVFMVLSIGLGFCARAAWQGRRWAAILGGSACVVVVIALAGASAWFRSYVHTRPGRSPSRASPSTSTTRRAERATKSTMQPMVAQVVACSGGCLCRR